MNDLQVLADVALYYVKTRSKNAYELYDPNKEYSNKNTSDIEFAISKALDNNDIYMVFQPEYDMKKKSITCFEALMRIKDCKYGPGEFIRIAEKNGSIIKLGRIAVVQAVEFAKKLLDNGIDNFTVSFNFSAVQVADIEFMDLLRELLIKNKVDAKYMNVEMTESVLFSNDKEVKEAIRQFTKLGLTLSLDDFGNGYSSIETLSNYKFNVVKFDKGLIDRMFKNNSIISLISVVHSYGYKVLAEGVETKEQFDYLKEKDCDIIQGYYISRPLDSDATITFVKEFDPKKRDL